MCYEIYEKQREKEQKKIVEYSREVEKWLKQNTPLHQHLMRYNPLSTVTNDCNWGYYQHEYSKWHKNAEAHSPICFWAIITYKDLEKAGFKTSFSKRVIEKYEDMEIIKRKRGIFGYTYSYTDIQSLREFIKPSREGIEITQNSYSRFPSMNWIFDFYTDNELNEMFDVYLNIVFMNIHNNIEWKDSVNI